MSLPTVDELVSAVRREDGVSFSPSRYPFTYACDLLRDNTSLIPRNVWKEFWSGGDLSAAGSHSLPSRSAASHMRQAWSAAIGVEDRVLAERLADAYLRLHGIERPEG